MRWWRVVITAAMGAAAATLVALLIPSPGSRSQASQVQQVPASIPADCSRNVEVELTNFIKTVPEGSTIQFPRRGCYAQGNRIEVVGRNNLVFDGNDATFKSSTPNVWAPQPNWFIMDSTKLTFHHMVVEGNFKVGGPRSPSVPGRIAPNQVNHGMAVFGGSNITIRDGTVRNTFGDGLYAGPSGVLKNQGPHVGIPTNIRFSRMSVSGTARMGAAFTGIVGGWIEDSRFSDIWYWGVDGEIDAPGQPMKDVHVLRNTFDGFYFGAITFPAPGQQGDVDDVEIRGNRSLSLNDYPCGTPIAITYWDVPSVKMTNVVIEDNTLKTDNYGVLFKRASGRVRNNVIEKLPGCSEATGTPVQVVDSPGAAVCDNRAPGYPPSSATAPCQGTPAADGSGAAATSTTSGPPTTQRRG